MKTLKKAVGTIRAIVNRPRVMHYLDIFLAGTATALYFNREHLLDAHGLDALGCVVCGGVVAGVKAAIEAYRKSFSTVTPPAA